MKTTDVIEKVAEYVTDRFSKLSIKEFSFHNIMHTRAVVSHVRGLGRSLELEAKLMEELIIAAWFHDIGYVISPENHEQESVRIAHEFLISENYPADSIANIESCIMATQMPQRPNSLMAMILCDADLYHLGGTDYFFWQMLLRQEWKQVWNKEYDDVQWHTLNLNFLQDHAYFTEFGKNYLELSKQENILKIKYILAAIA
ncbi:Predicted metal-dependent phosphohydrolase, HD superfamily [Pustulibacterium marinum]|uniref:Predicted metal-dependent phosphohydrolase, HD superfamily n=1 Tax=Pustulibacterium marinum TaxID=1224947 RepID=A0A1I7HUN5_9FLAO|nr:HD domain-containing protein [Pustulibacterium marinum]SFU64196.1 Predicted metal-dependent phosphohydrolase, HD superfamily [Pustulibacterium marinum]